MLANLCFLNKKPNLDLCSLNLSFQLNCMKLDQLGSVVQSWLLFVTPMDCSTPGFPAHHQLPKVCSNSCPWSQWCDPTISYSVIAFSSCLQSFPPSGYFPIGQFFASGGQSIGVSATTSAFPMNIQDWFPLGLIGLIYLQSKGLSRDFSNTTAQKHQFFGA